MEQEDLLQQVVVNYMLFYIIDWDSVIDGCCVVKWPKDKESKGEAVKNHMNCLVTVFASSLIA